MKEKMRDPVCGTIVNPQKVKWEYQFGVQTYYFCTLDCLVTFDEKRDKFVSQAVEGKGT
jgi:YHS domain-containing protein